jgi:hypothetical protein
LEGSAVIDEGQTSLSSLVFPAPFLAIDWFKVVIL